MAGIEGVGGLASGINSNDIIDALINADRGATRILESRKATFQARLDAVRGFNTRLLSAQLDLAALKRTSTFESCTATTGSAAVATATASSSAQAGTYQVTVERQAQAHQVVTKGFASATDTIGVGNVVLQLGSGATTTIAVGASNSSLNGLAASINASGGDIAAQVINDGSSSPYRLLLTAKSTGEDNAISFDADALVGGLSDELQKVVSTVDGATTSSLTSSGFFSGTNGPKQFLVEVEADGTAGTAGATATFKWSSDGGSTWTSGVAATDGALTLSDGVSVSFSAGDVHAGDQFVVRPLQQLAAAQDAKVRYGATGSYVTVESASNAITGLISGVTINAVGPGTTTVTVATQAGDASDAIHSFVDSYNEAIEYLRANASYDRSTGKAGPLLAQSDLRRALDQTTRSFLSAVPGLPQSMNSPTAVGISIDRDTGHLTIDDAKLNAKIAADPEGVMRIFANSGTSSDDGVQFATLSSKTDTSAAFNVHVLLAAQRAAVTTTSDLAASTVIGAGNNGLNLTINGRSYSVTLASGTYTREQLATQVQSAINAKATAADDVVVGLDGNALDLKSALYGSGQTIEVTGGTANAALFLSTTKATGLDVAATIDGHAATGKGQVLLGVTGQKSDGLRLTVTAASNTFATVTARKGAAQLAGDGITGMTDAHSGSVVQTENGLEDIVDGIGDRISKMEARLEQRRLRYQSMFVQMEKLIQGFQAQGNAISGQVAGFENMAASRARG